MVIYKFCIKLTGNKEDGEDLYQQTFLKAIELKHRIDKNNNPRSFLVSVAIKTWKNSVRKNNRRMLIIPSVNMNDYEVIDVKDTKTDTEEDIIKKEDDAGYDKTAFEKMLEIKGDSDHTKLIDMLTDLNDYSIGIEDVLKEHFDEENIVYWMAFQILMGNVDTQNRNVYLYSPLNSDIWYFIAWDNDGCLMRPEYELRNFSDQNSWEKGISNYWGNILFQRCLKSRSFREKLNDAILDLREYLNKDMLTSKIESYKNVLKPYLYLMPDAEYEPLTSEQYDQIAASLPDEIEKNYQLYLESLETPMPFYIGVPTIDGDKLKFNWDVSYDLDAEDITYSVEVARDYLFRDVIYQNTTLIVPEAEMDLPEAGQYFVRVRATNTSGKTQDAFDYYVTDEGKYYGMRCFYITEDSTVEEDDYEEG